MLQSFVCVFLFLLFDSFELSSLTVKSCTNDLRTQKYQEETQD